MASRAYPLGMRRSAVRSGLLDARDRATKKRRDRKHEGAEPDPTVALRDWLREWTLDLLIEEIERLDLRRFLQESDRFPLIPEERLRQLAIACEDQAICESGPRHWGAVDRIYQMALRLAPDDPCVLASRGVSAGSIAGFYKGEFVARLRRDAQRYLREASELLPDEPGFAYSTGLAIYEDESGSVEEALTFFDRAIELDPEYGWARLYRAHCLHDLERWSEAVAAYSEVPKQQFAGPPSWRMDVLLEQRGWCRLQAGDVDGAREDLERALSRYETQSNLATWSTLRYLREAADRHFPELRDRIRALDDRGP